ncbi:hypothetical protein E2C01_055038 [Portunus trituberculatus]|uniref:Uncharacterized protein n=1 Tax=Portunus trituberculatus TaxID=210409 RepID=A0A5B7GTR2_PORTR|nr:hypothetical protein [Portunus trituberculatus]
MAGVMTVEGFFGRSMGREVTDPPRQGTPTIPSHPCTTAPSPCRPSHVTILLTPSYLTPSSPHTT